MKPSASTSTSSTNTKSTSSSPSTSKSRSKKSSSSSSSSVHSSGSSTPQQSTTAQTNLNHSNRSNDHASTSSSNRDKNSQKSFTGINAESVKCIWDQIDTNDISINTDILPFIAEDASYKLWELINNVKTFSRHSGGKVTTDVVNEVLKNCSTAPVMGATNSEWQRFDYDGKFFCATDRILDLRQEYLKSTTLTQCGPIQIEASWITNSRYDKDLTKLWRSIILAIILGDDAAFQYTIHTTLINPFIGVILPELIQKTIEYLVFSCTDDTLDRLLNFLKVLVQNYHSRDVSNNEEYFNLCNLFLCLLLGTVNMKEKLDFIKLERDDMNTQQENEEHEARVVAAPAVATVAVAEVKAATTTIKSSSSSSSSSATTASSSSSSSTTVIGPIKREESNTDCTKDIYGNFVVNPVAFNTKTEITNMAIFNEDNQKFRDYGKTNTNTNTNTTTTTTTTSTTKYDRTNLFNNMRYQDDDIIFDMNINDPDNQTDTRSHQFSDDIKLSNTKSPRLTRDDIFSPFITEQCDDRFIDDVCMLIGYLSGRLGYFEHELTYLLSKRLEIFFFEPRTAWTVHDFQWLRRIVQALTYLGETAFRELTLYFEYIPHNEFPEWLIPYLSFGGIFIRGRHDIYFYEYMQEVCGDVLIPFLINFGAYMKKMDVRWKSYRRNQQKNEWSVNRRHTIRFSSRPVSLSMLTSTQSKSIQMFDMFPKCGPSIKKADKTYAFDVGVQIFSKPQIRLTADQQFIQSFDLCNKLNKKIVHCRMLRKLVRLNKCPNPKYFIDYRMYNL